MIGVQRHRVEIDPDFDQKAVEHALFLAVQYAYSAGVEGDVVEFGTMTGNSADALAQGIATFDGMKGRRPKNLHLFDSFQGMPELVSANDAEAPQVAAGMWKTGTAIDLSPDELRYRLNDTLEDGRIIVHAGWFRDTVPKFEKVVAVAHVDCDLYQSTMDALEPLFWNRQIAEGTIILFDDYGFNRASPNFGERRAWSEIVGRAGVVFSDEGAYGAMGHRFIVHGYRGLDV